MEAGWSARRTIVAITGVSGIRRPRARSAAGDEDREPPHCVKGRRSDACVRNRLFRGRPSRWPTSSTPQATSPQPYRAAHSRQWARSSHLLGAYPERYRPWCDVDAGCAGGFFELRKRVDAEHLVELEHFVGAQSRHGLCPVELCAGGSLPVRLEPRGRPAEQGEAECAQRDGPCGMGSPLVRAGGRRHRVKKRHRLCRL
jgi:hypothetical protein